MKKRLLFLFMTLIFIFGVQSVKANVFTYYEDGLVLVQDVLSVDMDTDIDQAILNLSENVATEILEFREGVITDNLKYPNLEIDAILNEDINTNLYSKSVDHTIMNTENTYNKYKRDYYWNKSLEIGEKKIQLLVRV